MDLKSRLLDPAQAVLLYGTTPPREGTAPVGVEAAADKLAARLQGLPLDGVVVYDIQDETGRSGAPRPFPFVGTVDPRSYAALLQQRIARPAIVYKALGSMDEPAWNAWLFDTAHAFPLRLVSVVGRPTSGVRHALGLSRAIRIAAGHPAGFAVGGVAIVVVDKNLEDLFELASRHVILSKGTVVFEGPTEALRGDQELIHRTLGV